MDSMAETVPSSISRAFSRLYSRPSSAITCCTSAGRLS
jgi:hypothetical protein